MTCNVCDRVTSNVGGSTPCIGLSFQPGGNPDPAGTIARLVSVCASANSTLTSAPQRSDTPPDGPPPGVIGRSGGGSVRHRSLLRGCGQRGWNGHPDGGCAGDGMSPASTMRRLVAWGFGSGTADSSARVYGWRGCA